MKYFSNVGSKTVIISEESLASILKEKFKGDVKVMDISGGCGAMYEIYVKSPDFKGISLVKQHQMINQVLKDQVKQMHGIRIFTEAG